LCEGGNVVGHKRCPNSIVNGDPAVAGAMRAYSYLDAYHVLPRDGGLLDQTPAFLKFNRLVSVERNELEAEEQRSRKRAAGK